KARSITNGFGGVLERFTPDYLDFFPAYRTVKWRLWLAFHERPLSPADLARREEQRNDLRKAIRAIPITNFHVVRTHGHAVAQLEKLFENPWHGWFHEPLSDDELARMKEERKHWNISDTITAHTHFDTIVMRVKATAMQDDATFGTGPLPLDAAVVANLKS